jgi:hypothetical protein
MWKKILIMDAAADMQFQSHVGVLKKLSLAGYGGYGIAD